MTEDRFPSSSRPVILDVAEPTKGDSGDNREPSMSMPDKILNEIPQSRFDGRLVLYGPVDSEIIGPFGIPCDTDKKEILIRWCDSGIVGHRLACGDFDAVYMYRRLEPRVSRSSSPELG